jgi:hypothetical protein
VEYFYYHLLILNDVFGVLAKNERLTPLTPRFLDEKEDIGKCCSLMHNTVGHSTITTNSHKIMNNTKASTSTTTTTTTTTMTMTITAMEQQQQQQQQRQSIRMQQQQQILQRTNRIELCFRMKLSHRVPLSPLIELGDIDYNNDYRQKSLSSSSTSSSLITSSLSRSSSSDTLLSNASNNASITSSTTTSSSPPVRRQQQQQQRIRVRQPLPVHIELTY